MKLTGMTIENFKGISKPVHIDFKPVTLLFGPNSAGKSTIVQALHYAREIFERGNVDPDRTLTGGENLDLGGFKTLVHNHELSRPVVMKFELDIEADQLPEYRDWVEDDTGAVHYFESDFYEIPARVNSCWVEIAIKWSAVAERPILKSYRVGISGKELAKIETSEDGRQISLSNFNMLHPVFHDPETTNDEIIRTLKELFEGKGDPDVEKLGPMFPLFLEFSRDEDGEYDLHQPIGITSQTQSAMPVWGRSLGFSSNNLSLIIDWEDQTIFKAIASSLIVGPGEMVRDVLRKFKYIGPIREVPKRNFQPSITYDESRWSNGLAAWDLLYKSDETFIAELNKWISREDKINTGYRVELKKTYELDVNSPLAMSLQSGDIIEEELVANELSRFPVKTQLVLKEELSRIEVHPQDIGVGISQVLPIIVASLASREGIIAMEQPELHIHPALQVALGDLFIARANESDACFLIETHSEHLILRLLRRIRETTENELPPGVNGFTSDKLSVLYIDKKDSGLEVLKLDVDDTGDFEAEWPKGFFEERDEELFF